MSKRFTWDANKSRLNRRRHGISFETASRMFDDSQAISFQDRDVEGEQRWQTIGSLAGMAIIVVAHTVTESGGDEMIRLISARKATPSERRLYDEAD